MELAAEEKKQAIDVLEIVVRGSSAAFAARSGNGKVELELESDT